MRGTSTRWLAGLAAVVLVAAACGGTPASNPSPGAKAFIPMISKGFQHQFWQAVKQGAEKAATQFNVTINFQGPENESQVDKQLEMLQTVLNQKPQALCFAALDSKAAIPLLQKFKDAKIPVIGFDSGVDSDIPLATAATDNSAAAGAAADKMASLIGGSGEVAIVAHDQTRPTEVDRPHEGDPAGEPEPQGSLRRERGLRDRCPQRREGIRQERQGRRHRLRLRSAADGRDPSRH